MQAGEKLNFVKNFGVSVEQNTPTVEGESVDQFLNICKRLLQQNPDKVEYADVYNDGVMLRAFESAYRITAHDRSYLHIVVHGHISVTHDAPIDVGLMIAEHACDEQYLQGYVYRFDEDGLARYTAPPEVDEEDTNNVDTTHFSLIGTYQAVEELLHLELSEYEEERALANDTRQEYEVRSDLEQMYIELGTEGRAPEVEEIEALAQLLEYALPLDKTA